MITSHIALTERSEERKLISMDEKQLVEWLEQEIVETKFRLRVLYQDSLRIENVMTPEFENIVRADIRLKSRLNTLFEVKNEIEEISRDMRSYPE